MADNYLERHRRDYEERKAQWLKRKRHLTTKIAREIEKPDDESL